MKNMSKQLMKMSQLTACDECGAKNKFGDMYGMKCKRCDERYRLKDMLDRNGVWKG